MAAAEAVAALPGGGNSIYSQYSERPAVLDSDVHAQGIAIALQVAGL
jgi:hypothetical protein